MKYFHISISWRLKKTFPFHGIEIDKFSWKDRFHEVAMTNTSL